MVVSDYTLRLIRQMMLKKYSREQIFTKIFLESSISNQEISEWFQEFDKNPFDADSGNLHINLLFAIGDEFLSRKTLVSFLPRFRRQKEVKFLDGRYSIRYKVENLVITKLVIFDCFYGLERTIPITDSDILQQHYVATCTIEVVDFNYILLHELHFYRRNTRIFLLELDFDNGKCSIVDRQFVQGSYIRLIFDSTNRRNFAIGFTQNAEMVVQRAKIENSLIQIDSTQFNGPLEINRMSCVQLLNDKIYGFTNPHDSETISAQFYEVSFNSTSKSLTEKLLLEFKGGDEIQYNSCFNDDYACSGSVWYFLEKYYAYNFLEESLCAFNFCKFDMTTGMFTKMGARGLGYVMEMHVDKNEIATICVANKNEEQKEQLHRFALSQPDDLKIQALLTLRRSAILSGDDSLWDKILEKLPPNLRPPNSYSKPEDQKEQTQSSDKLLSRDDL